MLAGTMVPFSPGLDTFMENDSSSSIPEDFKLTSEDSLLLPGPLLRELRNKSGSAGGMKRLRRVNIFFSGVQQFFTEATLGGIG